MEYLSVSEKEIRDLHFIDELVDNVWIYQYNYAIFFSLRDDEADKDIGLIFSYLWSLSANFRSFEMLRYCRREWIIGGHAPVIMILVTELVCFAQYRTIIMPMKFGKRTPRHAISLICRRDRIWFLKSL